MSIFLTMGVFSFLRCNKMQTDRVVVIEYPPFAIHKTTVRSKHYNYSTNRTSTHVYSKNVIHYKGNPVELPVKTEQNTGFNHIWKVYILKDAPEPALLAGSQSFYLITEKDGEAILTPVIEQNSGDIKIQVLDGPYGKPKVPYSVMVHEDTSSTHQFSEGEFLLFNKSTVLYIPELKIFSFQIYQNNIDDFYPNQVLSFSPNHDKIAFLGSKNTGREDEAHAVISYNFKYNTASFVPFNRSKTRLHEPYLAGRSWFDTWFHWAGVGVDEMEVEFIKPDDPVAWTGHFSPDQTSYSLSPTKTGFQKIFADFVRDYLELISDQMKEDIFNEKITQNCTCFWVV